MMKRLWIAVVIGGFFLSSCASVPAVQGRVRRLAAKGDFDQAAQVMSRLSVGSYGKNNRLLESLDRGMIFYYAGQHEQSIAAFEDAKKIYDALYTESISKIAASWLWNDAALPYAGEDFERAMVNVVQALNFIALGQYDAALVEARNASAVLQTVNDRYPVGQKNVYADDAFVQLLMGIIYESLGERQNINDAFISYRRALDIYQSAFYEHYHLDVPNVLKENLLAAARWMGAREAEHYQRLFPQISSPLLEDRRQQAEVYLLYFRGQIINKVQSGIVLPGMDGLLTRVSFPRYRTGFKAQRPIVVEVNGLEGGTTRSVALERVHDLDAVARKNLDDRRVRIMAKAVARPVTKQFLVEVLEDQVSDAAGTDAASVFRYAGNVYLLYSEQADLRAWETLPSEIYMGRVILPPGQYQFLADGHKIMDLFLSSGDKKFIMHWSGY